MIRVSFSNRGDRDQRVSDAFAEMERQVAKLELEAGLNASQMRRAMDETQRILIDNDPAGTNIYNNIETLQDVWVEAPYDDSIITIYAEWEGRWTSDTPYGSAYEARCQTSITLHDFPEDAFNASIGDKISFRTWGYGNAFDWRRIGMANSLDVSNPSTSNSANPGDAGTNPYLTTWMIPARKAGRFSFGLLHEPAGLGTNTMDIRNQRLVVGCL